MEEYLAENESVVELIELIENHTKNFYFYINLLYFIHYMNNFPKLKKEKINRLKFYFSNLFNKISAINTERLYINIDNIKITNMFTAELLRSVNIPVSNKNVLSFMIAITLTLQSYREISNLIPKKNIFTKSIESKINIVISAVVTKLKKEFNKYYNKSLDVLDIYDLCEKTLANKYFKELRLRQKNRFLGKNVNKYPIDNFICIQNTKQILNKYNEVISNKNAYSYERSFILNIFDLVDKV